MQEDPTSGKGPNTKNTNGGHEPSSKRTYPNEPIQTNLSERAYPHGAVILPPYKKRPAKATAVSGPRASQAQLVQALHLVQQEPAVAGVIDRNDLLDLDLLL